MSNDFCEYSALDAQALTAGSRRNTLANAMSIVMPWPKRLPWFAVLMGLLTYDETAPFQFCPYPWPEYDGYHNACRSCCGRANERTNERLIAEEHDEKERT
jgi:hypothetical protein